MQCDNCRTEGDLAFTLAAYPSEDGDAVLVDFCSSDCLQAWTSTGNGELDGWSWGVDEAERREAVTPTQ